MAKITKEELIEFFGSQKDMADRMGLSESAVSQYLNTLGFPAFRSIQIEIMSDGKFKASDILESNVFFKQKLENTDVEPE